MIAAPTYVSHFSVQFQHTDNASLSVSLSSNELGDKNFFLGKLLLSSPLFTKKLPALASLLCWENLLLILCYLNSSTLSICTTTEHCFSLASAVAKSINYNVLWFEKLWNVLEVLSFGHVMLSYQCDSDPEDWAIRCLTGVIAGKQRVGTQEKHGPDDLHFSFIYTKLSLKEALVRCCWTPEVTRRE